MSSTPTPWDPQSPEVQRDQRAAYDKLRERCPLAHSASQQTPGGDALGRSHADGRRGVGI